MKRMVLSAMLLIAAVSFALSLSNVKAVNQKKENQSVYTELYEKSLGNRSSVIESTDESESGPAVLKQINYTSRRLPKEEKPRNYIFIGDSRTVNISTEDKNYENVKFFCQQGATYSFMTKAFQKALANCEKGKENIIVSWFGINNITEVNKYIRYYNTISLPENVRLVVMSLTDGRDSKGRAINIEDFNGIVQDNAENYKFLDLTDRIGTGKELDVTDSAKLHYTKNADKVFAVIMEKLEALSLE